ncbi:pimeloyl-ACP methyl ester carboxylesterase [Kineosphaera limosa]|uniref:alpha/beta fold hydrolase n=1 Tax=Kineosphaera limosa TaxID=111564 RepID=UPI0002D74247|nr:alpha/beta hydrolase [Kineosphaera limosa]NYE01426.1 pimeloyl-ACP methyl ester carboxylesterase [Kineosphaera limosa]
MEIAQQRESRPSVAQVDFGDGQLAVIDYGASAAPDAVPVLLAHSLGNCADTWQFVGPAFSDRIHAYALDLAGHGSSTATVRTFDDAWQQFIEVSRGLGLDRPVLVGHDQSTFQTSLAAMEAPQEFRAVVSIGGAVHIDYEKARQDIDFALLPTFADMLRERFLLGATGSGRQEADNLIEQLVGLSTQDWLLAGMREGLHTEVANSVEYFDDGTWLHKPAPEMVQRSVDVPDRRPITPGPWFYDRLTVPQWIVQLREGYEVLTPDGAEFVAEHPMLRHAYLDTTAWPQYDKPAELAAVIEAIALDPAGPDL